MKIINPITYFFKATTPVLKLNNTGQTIQSITIEYKNRIWCWLSRLDPIFAHLPFYKKSAYNLSHVKNYLDGATSKNLYGEKSVKQLKKLRLGQLNTIKVNKLFDNLFIFHHLCLTNNQIKNSSSSVLFQTILDFPYDKFLLFSLTEYRGEQELDITVRNLTKLLIDPDIENFFDSTKSLENFEEKIKLLKVLHYINSEQTKTYILHKMIPIFQQNPHLLKTDLIYAILKAEAFTMIDYLIEFLSLKTTAISSFEKIINTLCRAEGNLLIYPLVYSTDTVQQIQAKQIPYSTWAKQALNPHDDIDQNLDKVNLAFSQSDFLFRSELINMTEIEAKNPDLFQQMISKFVLQSNSSLAPLFSMPEVQAITYPYLLKKLKEENAPCQLLANKIIKAKKELHLQDQHEILQLATLVEMKYKGKYLLPSDFFEYPANYIEGPLTPTRSLRKLLTHLKLLEASHTYIKSLLNNPLTQNKVSIALAVISNRHALQLDNQHEILYLAYSMSMKKLWGSIIQSNFFDSLPVITDWNRLQAHSISQLKKITAETVEHAFRDSTFKQANDTYLMQNLTESQGSTTGYQLANQIIKDQKLLQLENQHEIMQLAYLMRIKERWADLIHPAFFIDPHSFMHFLIPAKISLLELFAIKELRDASHAYMLETLTNSINLEEKYKLAQQILDHQQSLRLDTQNEIVQRSMMLDLHEQCFSFITPVFFTHPEHFIDVFQFTKYWVRGGSWDYLSLINYLFSIKELREANYAYMLETLKRLTDLKEKFVLATIIMANREAFLLDDQDELMELMINLIIQCDPEALKNKRNPYSVYQALDQARKQENLISLSLPISFLQNKSVKWNLSSLRGKGSFTGYTIKELPQGIDEQILLQLFTSLKQRAGLDPEINEYIEGAHGHSLSLLETNLTKDTLIAKLLIKKDQVNLLSFQLYKIIDMILTSSQQVEGKLTAQEEMLLKFSSTVQNCEGGRKDGIQRFYQFCYKGLTLKTVDNRIENFVDSCMQELLQENFSNETWLRELPTGLKQAAHLTIYLKNRLAHQVGLKHELTFDEHTEVLSESVIDLSTETLLLSYFNHLTPQVLIDKLIAHSVKLFTYTDSYKLLIALLEDKLTVNYEEILEYDEDFAPFKLTPLGALNLLQACDYVE